MVTDKTVISLFILDNDYCLYSGQLRSRQSTGPDGLICNASWVTGDSCLICFINKPSVYFNLFWFDCGYSWGLNCMLCFVWSDLDDFLYDLIYTVGLTCFMIVFGAILVCRFLCSWSVVFLVVFVFFVVRSGALVYYF